MKNLKDKDSKFGIFAIKINNYVWHRRRRVSFILFIVMLLVRIRCQKWHVLWVKGWRN
jgi:hypothetical protein